MIAIIGVVLAEGASTDYADSMFNTLTKQHARHDKDDSLICTLVHVNRCILIHIWLQFVAKFPIRNTSALIRSKVYVPIGQDPLSKPMIG